MGRRTAILILFILCSLITRALFLKVEVLDIDETAHIVGSWQLLDGKLLYTDFVNNKPPLLYVYYAIAQVLFGRGMFSVHLLTALFVVPLTAFAVSAFYNHSRTGLVGGIVFLIYSAAFLAHDMHASNTEILMILPVAWALVFVRDEEKAQHPFRIAAAGFLIGLGALFKQPVGVWLFAILISSITISIFKKKPARIFRILPIAFVFFVLPILATYYYFYLRGGADEFVYWTVLNNLRYSANPISLNEGIGRAASYLLPFLLVTSLLWWCTYRSFALQKSKYRKLLIALLLLLSLAAGFVGFRFYPHYFILLYVPLSLGAAPYADRLLQRPLSRYGIALIAYSLLLWIGFTIANAILYFGNQQVYRETDPVFHSVAQRLKKDTCYKNASMFVWGYAPIFYYYSEVKAASRFVVLPQSGLTSYISGNLGSVGGNRPSQIVAIQKHWDLLMSDLETSGATYILDTSPAAIYRWDKYPLRDYPRLHQYIEENYDRLDEIDSVVIYRRRDCL